ncbi:MAG TPA: GDYXXLXY domain-containing protein [Planctomycetota bacterium]|nr:GDYXXLXY domain-containing protein [Planctomycetota bacterium]
MRWKLAAGWVLAQVLFFAAWAAVEQRRHTVGDSILVRTMPVDPRDLLSGQYQALSYEFSRPMTLRDLGRDPNEGESVWVVLRPEGDFYVPDHAESNRPFDLSSGQVAIVGRRERWRTMFGVEKYFVPEGTETPSQRDITVRLRVNADGLARIQEVLVRGKPWP